MSIPRRVITGVNAEGRSCILFDGPSQTLIWATESAIADNATVADTGRDTFDFPLSGSRFIFHDFPPRSTIPTHATDTIDYIVVVSGEVAFTTETGEVHLRAGDVLVDRGIVHGWRNDSDAPCRIMNVLCPARPLGKGATMAGTVRG